MAGPHDIVVIGASAGGIQALTDILSLVSHDFPGSIFVVVHTAPTSTSLLPQVLGRLCRLPVKHATHGDEIKSGTVYIAPPDHHLLVRDGFVEVTRGPRENRFRPAVDPLFRSAARAYGPRTIGVVLSGALGDGTAGLLAVKAHGGIALVQDPEQAIVDGMPRSALRLVDVDGVLSTSEIASAIEHYARESLYETDDTVVGDDVPANAIIQEDIAEQARDLRNHELTLFSCPDCGGSLWQVDEGPLLRFHCHVGHAFSVETLVFLKSEEIEAALWQCVRLLTERSTLANQVLARRKSQNNTTYLADFEEQVDSDERHAQVIRSLLEVVTNPLSDQV